VEGGISAIEKELEKIKDMGEKHKKKSTPKVTGGDRRLRRRVGGKGESGKKKGGKEPQEED